MRITQVTYRCKGCQARGGITQGLNEVQGGSKGAVP